MKYAYHSVQSGKNGFLESIYILVNTTT